MKLYHQSGTCSLASRIALEESGVAYEAARVVCERTGNAVRQSLPDGSDFRAVSPLGYVPVLELEDGRRLFENPAILLYIADHAPGKNLAPSPDNGFARAKVLERLCFISSEVHKGFVPLFVGAPEPSKDAARQRLRELFAWLDRELQGREYQFASGFTVADAYLFTVLSWTEFARVDLGGLENIAAFRVRIAARPTVTRALALEKA